MPDAVATKLGLRTGALLWAAAFAAAALVGTHGVAYWDAGDYVRQAIEGIPSGLLLGRPLFLAVSRGVLALGVDPAWAEPVLRWFWSAVSALGAPALAALALAIGLPRRAAIVAGLTLAFSPAFAHTSHHVLTDAPALVLSITALLAAARGQAVAAGLLIAAAIATRETAGLHLVAIALLLGRRSIVAVAVTIASLAAIIWMFPPVGLWSWFSAMGRSAASHPLDLLHVAAAAAWVFAAGPAPVLLGLAATPGMARRPDRLRLIAIPSLAATLVLLFYPDGSFSPRYALAAAPLAFFLTAAPWLAARPRAAAALLITPLLLMPWLATRSYKLADRGRIVMARVPALPAGAVVVPGHYCPHVSLAATIAGRRDLTLICPGWGWPADLAATLDKALAAGHDVVIDPAEDAWLRGREIPLSQAIRRWMAGREGRAVDGWVIFRR